MFRGNIQHMVDIIFLDYLYLLVLIVI